MKYRIRNVFKFIRENKHLEIDLKEVNVMEKIIEIEFKKVRLKMEV